MELKPFDLQWERTQIKVMIAGGMPLPSSRIDSSPSGLLAKNLRRLE